MSNIFFEIGQENNNARKNRQRLLFVEGTDDAYFLDRLLIEANAAPAEVGIVPVGGLGQFSSQMKSLTLTTNFTRNIVKGVAIIRDAGESFETTNRETSALFATHFGVRVEHGQVVWHSGKAFGYFLMPGASEDGDLEKLCLNTVDGSELARQSEEFIRATNPQPTDHIFKRKAQIYLAGHADELSRGAGRGFNTGRFNAAHVSLNPLKEFLSNFVRTVPEEQIQA